MKKEKTVGFSILIIIIISVILFFNLNQEKKCKENLDCFIDDCCNPTSCVFKENAPTCGSITVCDKLPVETTCECIDGECVIKKN